MNSNEFNHLVDETIKKTAELLKAKGSEYSSDTDRLANFKKGAEETGLTPLQVAHVYMRKHYDSISTYVRKEAKGLTQTLSEPIEGRFHDLINYCFLMLALIEEENELTASNSYIKSLSGEAHLADPWPNLPQEEPFPTINLTREEQYNFIKAIEGTSETGSRVATVKAV